MTLSAPSSPRFATWADSAERVMLLLTPVMLASFSGVADVFCSLIDLLFVGRAVARRDFAWIRRPWLTILLAIWLYLGLRGLVSAHPGRSFAEALIWIRYPIFAVAISDRLRDEAFRNRLITVSAWSVMLLSLDAILQYVVGHDIIGRPIESDRRLTGPFSAPRVGIGIAWMFLPPLMGLLDQRRWALAAGVGASALLAITLSGERMALVTVVLDVVLLGLLLQQWRRQRLIILGVLAVILVALFVSQPALFDRQILSIGRTAMNLGHSPYGVIWNRALVMAADHPVFGVGMYNYRVLCIDPVYGPIDLKDPLPLCSTHPHNFYIEWLVAGGIPVLVGFLVAMILLLRDLLVKTTVRDSLFAGLVATIMMRLWFFAPTTSFFLSWSAIPLFLYVGWALSYLPVQKRGWAKRTDPVPAPPTGKGLQALS